MNITEYEYPKNMRPADKILTNAVIRVISAPNPPPSESTLLKEDVIKAKTIDELKVILIKILDKED